MSQFRLAQLYIDSIDYKDLLKAYTWLSVAEKRGSKQAALLKREIASMLSSQEFGVAIKAVPEIYNAIYINSDDEKYLLEPPLFQLSRSVLLVTAWLEENRIRIPADSVPAIDLVTKEKIVRRALEIEQRKGGRADEITILASYQSFADVPVRALYDEYRQTVLMLQDWPYKTIAGRLSWSMSWFIIIR